MNSRHKKRRAERPDDPTKPLNARLPGTHLKFLHASEWSVSSRLMEAVELLMKQEGYVPNVPSLPAGVRPIKDPGEYAALTSDLDRYVYLAGMGFAESDLCVHLRCNRRYLAKLFRELKALNRIAAEEWAAQPRVTPLREQEVEL